MVENPLVLVINRAHPVKNWLNKNSRISYLSLMKRPVLNKFNFMDISIITLIGSMGKSGHRGELDGSND